MSNKNDYEVSQLVKDYVAGLESEIDDDDVCARRVLTQYVRGSFPPGPVQPNWSFGGSKTGPLPYMRALPPVRPPNDSQPEIAPSEQYSEENGILFGPRLHGMVPPNDPGSLDQMMKDRMESAYRTVKPASEIAQQELVVISKAAKHNLSGCEVGKLDGFKSKNGGCVVFDFEKIPANSKHLTPTDEFLERIQYNSGRALPIIGTGSRMFFPDGHPLDATVEPASSLAGPSGSNQDDEVAGSSKAKTISSMLIVENMLAVPGLGCTVLSLDKLKDDRLEISKDRNWLMKVPKKGPKLEAMLEAGETPRTSERNPKRLKTSHEGQEVEGDYKFRVVKHPTLDLWVLDLKGLAVKGVVPWFDNPELSVPAADGFDIIPPPTLPEGLTPNQEYVIMKSWAS